MTSPDDDESPKGDLTMRVPAMPGDANANGDIFGGWVMSQMDLSAGIRGVERARGRVATVAVDTLVFRRPVKIGDTLCVYTTLVKTGRTSMTIEVEAWAQRRLTREQTKVTEGVFTMVAIDEDGRPVSLPPEQEP